MTNHEFPLWSAFREGGCFGAGMPAEISLNPFSLFILLGGVVKGLNFSWYILYFGGALSMYYLTRCVLKYNVFGAAYSAIVFSMNGFFPEKQLDAFIYARETILLPLIMVFFLKAINDNRYIVFTGLMLALFFIQTALYFCVIVLFLFVFAILNSFRISDGKIRLTKRHLIVFFASLFFALLISAGKLFPLLEVMNFNVGLNDFKEAAIVSQANTIPILMQRLFAPGNSGPAEMYIGYWPVGLCLITGIVAYKRLWSWFFVLFVFILLSFGNNAVFNLHKLVSHVPGFKAIIEVAKYYGLIIVFTISVISGAFFGLIKKPLLRTLKVLIIIIPLLFTYGDLLWANSGYFNYYTGQLPEIIDQGDFFQVRSVGVPQDDEGTQSAILPALYSKGIGLINAGYFSKERVEKDKILKFFDEKKIIPKYFILPKYVFLMPSTDMFALPNKNYMGEAWFMSGYNTVTDFSIKTNSIRIKVNIKSADRLIINQNYSRWWKSAGYKVTDYNGKLSVFLDKPGESDVDLRFIPWNFYIGLVVSLGTVLCSVGWLKKYRVNR
ncbi:MAG: hypothetical protein ABII88_00505 [Candidatus Omnitrophota bacterium]